MYMTLVLMPLFSSIFCGFFGYAIGTTGANAISVFSLLITLLLSITTFYEVGFYETPCYIKMNTWVDSGLFYADWGFLFDSLTTVMLIVVTLISFLVHLYSVEYMSHDPHQPRFMSYLSLFTFFMLILVTSDNFIQLFLGWEGVGLCSYLLINFWFTRIQANKAAIKAMLVNRIGDFGLALGIFMLYIYIGSIEFDTVFALIPFFIKETIFIFNWNFDLIFLISFFLFIGAVGKSAQIGLHTWLPDAMEGPTPVSALIHAATMVTAGVFLLGRCSPIFEFSPEALNIIVYVGAATSIFAATTGLLQNDLKKVIAYSTCSQLGYMVFSCGLSYYQAGIFHLANHAFFKALLFLGAGSVIHAVSDEQDMRKMGGLKNLIPYTFSMMLIGSYALMGFPFLSGFYSKDAILEAAFAKETNSGSFAYVLGSCAAFFTAFYSTRLTYLTFLSRTNGYKPVIEGAHEPSFNMTFPLFCLAIPSIFFGYLTHDLFIGLGSSFWNNSIYVTPSNYIASDAEFIPFKFKILPVTASFCGLFLALYLYNRQRKALFLLKKSYIGIKLYSFFNRKWFFDKVYNEKIAQTILYLGYFFTYKTIDRGAFEMMGPFGFTAGSLAITEALTKSQLGNVFTYISNIYLSFILTVFFFCAIETSIIPVGLIAFIKYMLGM